MKTLSNLEIGQTFSFFRKNSELIYMGYLNGDFHFVYKYAENTDVYTTSKDDKITIKN